MIRAFQSGQLGRFARDHLWWHSALVVNGRGSEGSVTIRDESRLTNHAAATVGGNAKVTLLDADFPQGCLIFDGSGDYVRFASHARRDMHATASISTTTNWTFEADVDWTDPGTAVATVAYKGFPGSGGDGDPGWGIAIEGDGKVDFIVGLNTPTSQFGLWQTTTALVSGARTVLCCEVVDGVPNIKFNGVVQAGAFVASTLTTWRASSGAKSGALLYLGAAGIDSVHPSPSQFLTGKLARIRVTYGIARYRGNNYAVPHGPLSTG
jgi:hypothetical protein